MKNDATKTNFYPNADRKRVITHLVVSTVIMVLISVTIFTFEIIDFTSIKDMSINNIIFIIMGITFSIIAVKFYLELVSVIRHYTGLTIMDLKMVVPLQVDGFFQIFRENSIDYSEIDIVNIFYSIKDEQRTMLIELNKARDERLNNNSAPSNKKGTNNDYKLPHNIQGVEIYFNNGGKRRVKIEADDYLNGSIVPSILLKKILRYNKIKYR